MILRLRQMVPERLRESVVIVPTSECETRDFQWRWRNFGFSIIPTTLSLKSNGVYVCVIAYDIFCCNKEWMLDICICVIIWSLCALWPSASLVYHLLSTFIERFWVRTIFLISVVFLFFGFKERKKSSAKLCLLRRLIAISFGENVLIQSKYIIRIRKLWYVDITSANQWHYLFIIILCYTLVLLIFICNMERRTFRFFTKRYFILSIFSFLFIGLLMQSV